MLHMGFCKVKQTLIFHNSVQMAAILSELIRKEICLNEQELSMVRHKMNQLGTRNFGAYARKMLIDGYIIKVDYY